MILVFREFFLKPLFIQSAVGRGFYPSVSLTWLLDQEDQKVTFQQQEHVSENAKWECFSLTHVWVFLTLWTVAHQAPLSVEFSRHEHWSGEPLPSPGDLPDPGIEPRSPALLQADSLPVELPRNILCISITQLSFLFANKIETIKLLQQSGKSVTID